MLKTKLFLVLLLLAGIPLVSWGGETESAKDKLQRLETMKEQGLMSESEYKDARMKIILDSADKTPSSIIESKPETRISGHAKFIWPFAFLPGVSQWERGDYGRSIVFGLGIPLGWVAADYYGTIGDMNYNYYQGAFTADSAKQYRQQATAADNMYSISGYATIGLYIWNVADAFIYKDKFDTPDDQATTIVPKITLAMNRNRTEEVILRWKL